MDLILGIIIGVIALCVLVALHELGHAITATRNGVRVDEFGIGMPPRAWKKKLKSGLILSLNWLPLGGFVRLHGEYDAAKGEGMYGSASYWQKTKILLAGVAINWLTAVVIFTGLALVGIPKVVDNQFSIQSDSHQTTKPVEAVVIVKGSPAEKAGLQIGDYLLSIDSQKINSPEQLADYTKAHAGQEVSLTYQRDGQQHVKQLTLRDSSSDGQLGVGPTQRSAIRSTWSAPIVGVGLTTQLTGLTLQGLGQIVVDLVTGTAQRFSLDADTRAEGKQTVSQVSNSVAGPVGIFAVIFPAAEKAGLAQLALLIGLISLTLAVMNMLPIPGLDGGRWFVMTLFKLFKKDLTKEREEVIQASGFLILIALIILVTVGDVKKLIP